MSSFDDTIQKTREIFDTAAKKTGEFVTVSKQKIKLSSLCGELNTAYAKLGKHCFNELKGNEVDDPEVATAIDEIKALINEIKLLKEEIDDAQGKVVCPECGERSPKNSAFCNKCGAKLN